MRVEKAKFDDLLGKLLKTKAGGEEMRNRFLVTGIEAQEVWRGAAPFDSKGAGVDASV
jgi:hypothetical protein